MHYPRVRIKSVAQGCRNLPPMAGLKRESYVGPTTQGTLGLCAKKSLVFFILYS
jgi:hypothetical protein